MDVPAVCKVDPFMLRNVFRNLFENSITACGENAEIDVTISPSHVDGAPAFQISIRDNGPGLSPEEMEHAFDAFFTTKTRGTGLGLAIVKRIVEAHSGTRRVRPQRPPRSGSLHHASSKRHSVVSKNSDEPRGPKTPNKGKSLLQLLCDNQIETTLMAKKKTSSQTTDTRTLRQRAETLLGAKPADMPTMPTADVQALVHELNVHQIELEIQNEELRQSQLELAHSRDRYSDLYDFAPVGYVTLDKDGRILEANLSAATFLGVERKSLIGANLSTWIDRDAQDDFFLHRRAVFSGNARQICEVKMYKSDGTPKAVRLESIAQETGHPRQCRTALIDVTQQQAAQSALHQLTETLEQRVVEQTYDVQLLAAIVHSSNDAITSKSLDGTIDSWNNAAERIYGYSEEEVLGKSIMMLIPPDRFDEELRMLQQVGCGKRVEHFETVRQCKAGRAIDVSLSVSPINDSDGRIVGASIIARDITERKQMERALKESEERLRVILNTAADVIITIDHRGIIESVNSATEQMFGYQQDELVGQNVRILMPAPYSNEHDGYIARYLETGEARIIGIGRDVTGRRKDGSTFPISLAVSEVKHLGLFTGIIRDISERKKLQREVLGIAEDEQRRIGQDLHDSTQQELAGLGMLAQTLLENLSKEADKRDDPQASRLRELAMKDRERNHTNASGCASHR